MEGQGFFSWQKSFKAELKELKTVSEQDSLPVKTGSLFRKYKIFRWLPSITRWQHTAAI
jgi:hypothetical protein